MKKPIPCGRIVVNSEGQVKKLHLANGGGTRQCNWEHIDMDFDEIHEALRKVFGLDSKTEKSVLYDFKLEPLKKNQYRTFFEYISSNGLKFNATLLYLCTSSDHNSFKSPEKRPASVVNHPAKRIPQVEADSSTSPVVIKLDGPPSPPPPQATASSNAPPIPPPISLSQYCFDRSLDELIVHFRELLHSSPRESILIRVFEDICRLAGLSSLVLDRLKQEIAAAAKFETSPIYAVALDKIDKLSRTIKVSLELNRMKITPAEQYAVLFDAFEHFRRHFYVLRDRWIEQTRDSSRRESSSHHRSATNDPKRDRSSLFQPILKCLDRLLYLIDRRKVSSSFSHLIESVIDEIKSVRRDPPSNRQIEEMIISVEKRLTKKIDEQNHRSSPHSLGREVNSAIDRTLDAIRDLLSSLRRQSRSHESPPPRARRSLWSTPPPPVVVSLSPEPMEFKPSVPREKNNNTFQHRMDQDENDLSSEASHSSYGEDDLMKTARDAYNKRPNRSDL